MESTKVTAGGASSSGTSAGVMISVLGLKRLAPIEETDASRNRYTCEGRIPEAMCAVQPVVQLKSCMVMNDFSASTSVKVQLAGPSVHKTDETSIR